MELIDRQDKGLAFMLQFENVAWFDKGVVRLLDRRIYPIKTSFVECHHYQEVADAIRDMVTQSEGPYVAAAMGMALAVHGVKNEDETKIVETVEKAAYVLSHARPTTTHQMQGIVNQSKDKVVEALRAGKKGEELVEVAFLYAYNYVNENYRRYSKIGEILANRLPDKATVMTQCFGGTIVGTMIRAAQAMGKELTMYCAETRPYYQGARLTASVACDMGVDVTVISDNMTAYTMKTKGVDLFTSASDVITMDGHVVNKVGTFQMALAAKYYGIPYYCTGTPDPNHIDCSNVVIEQRDGELVKRSFDTQITMDGVKGYYPAFDITPPELVTGIVTDKGILKPSELTNYFEEEIKSC